MSEKTEYLDKDLFFEKYPERKDDFDASQLTWGNLVEIYKDYISRKDKLESTGKSLIEILRTVEGVHSIRFRMKAPEHLIEKIIRKYNDYKNSSLDIPNKYENISKQNYLKIVTDLIGIRIIHLFKDDWLPIHKFILNNWERKEEPTAYYREGDDSDYLNQFEDEGCEVQKHNAGYRSIHYLVVSSPTKESHIAEIQVRTIFEEGWSEIDHNIRYPYHVDDIHLSKYLSYINRMAGIADEMATFIKEFKDRINSVSASRKKKEIQSESETLTILKEAFESLDEWEIYKKGTIELTSDHKLTGTNSLLKLKHSDPHGGFRKLNKYYSPGIKFTGHIYRPTMRDEEKGGQADRLALLDEYFNGYGFAVVHQKDKIWIESRNQGKGKAISEETDIPSKFNSLMDQWYFFELTIDEGHFLHLYLYTNQQELVASLENVYDTNYKKFDRISVHGGWPYYVDNIEVYQQISTGATD